jgi:hypothetical protein
MNNKLKEQYKYWAVDTTNDTYYEVISYLNKEYNQDWE